MLEHQKTILKSISYNPVLFKKELKKSVKWLSSDDLIMLYDWLIANFGRNYLQLITETIPVHQ
ncbi:MAG: hypothetical protein GXO79_08830 [Chlorobi bacterium]|nr:hypothetical protein [Chlorobiota bacterium]